MKSFENATLPALRDDNPGLLVGQQECNLFQLLLKIESELRKEVRSKSRIAVARKWIFGSQ
jgi:hypothetical protein